MLISFPTYFMIMWTIGFTLAVALFSVDDRIAKHVCQKEGRHYSWWDSFDLYWQWRKLKPSWFREAQDAGYLKARVILIAAFICFVVGASILSRSGLAPRMPPLRSQPTVWIEDPGSAALRAAVRDAPCAIT